MTSQSERTWSSSHGAAITPLSRITGATFASDRTLVYRGDTFNDFPIGGDKIICFNKDDVALFSTHSLTRR